MSNLNKDDTPAKVVDKKVVVNNVDVENNSTEPTKIKLKEAIINFVDSLHHIFPDVVVYDDVVNEGTAINNNAYNFFQIHQVTVPTVFTDEDGNYHILSEGKITSTDSNVVSVDDEGLVSRVGNIGDTVVLTFTASYPVPGTLDEKNKVISTISYKLAKLIE